MNTRTSVNIYNCWLDVGPLVCQLNTTTHTLRTNGSHHHSFVDVFVYLTSFLSAIFVVSLPYVERQKQPQINKLI